MPKLPADLPENWTQGQTISPNGTEVGLTEQYGYNYLMKQVNDTQTEVNNINDALPDVAQQATVEEINNKIGTEGDADTQPTLFGRLAQLKNVLLEKLAELLTKVTGIDGKIGDIGDPAGEESLVGLVKNIPKTVPTGAVKSVQFGVITGQNGTTAAGYTEQIAISEVDPGKCLVLIHSLFISGSGTIGLGCYLKNLTKTELTLQVVGYMKVSWQVIEFF